MSGQNSLSEILLSNVRPFRVRRLPWLGAAGLALALAMALPAVAGELYQWKDANGVTHYSDSPPPGQADYQNRTIRDSGTSAIAVEAAEKPAESAQCTTARGNLKLLQGEGPVGMDTDEDGKPDSALSADQRAAQSALAEAAIKVHCSGSAERAAEAS